MATRQWGEEGRRTQVEGDFLKFPGAAQHALGPLLIGIIAIGLLGAGIFVGDPMNGYPPRTPDVPLRHSVPSRLHLLFSFVVFLGLPIACFVFSRLFTRAGARSCANYSAVTGIACVVKFMVTIENLSHPEASVNHAGLFQRLTLTMGWAWLTLLASTC